MKSKFIIFVIDGPNNPADPNEIEQDGSLFEASEYYSGFWLIEAANEEEARELALEGSRACNRRVELRPYL